jgi:hypothetical protein
MRARCRNYARGRLSEKASNMRGSLQLPPKTKGRGLSTAAFSVNSKNAYQVLVSVTLTSRFRSE